MEGDIKRMVWRFTASPGQFELLRALPYQVILVSTVGTRRQGIFYSTVSKEPLWFHSAVPGIVMSPVVQGFPFALRWFLERCFLVYDVYFNGLARGSVLAALMRCGIDRRDLCARCPSVIHMRHSCPAQDDVMTQPCESSDSE